MEAHCMTFKCGSKVKGLDIGHVQYVMHCQFGLQANWCVLHTGNGRCSLLLAVGQETRAAVCMLGD